MKTVQLLTALSVLCPALAMGATHDIHSTYGLYVKEPGGNYSALTAEISFFWMDNTTTAHSRAQLRTSTNDVFVFELLSVTAPNTSSSITGKWNISKNGALVCSECQGQASGLSGREFKFYGGPTGNTSGYHFSGNVMFRSDS